MRSLLLRASWCMCRVLRVLDIAMDCGFNSMSYFIEVFRTEYDATPLQYRKKLEEIKVPK